MRLRRLAAAAMSMALMFSTAVYANDADAVAVYQEMEAKTKTMSDINAFVDVNVHMTDGKETIGARVEMNLKANHLTSPELMKLMLYMRMSELSHASSQRETGGPGASDGYNSGQSAPIIGSVYYGDGMYYMDMMGIKVRYAIDLSDIMEQVSSLDEMMNISTLDYLENLKLTTDGENRILTYTMNADKMNQLLTRILGDETMRLLTEDITIQYREISGEYIVNPEGYYTKAKLNMVIDMSAEGETITMSIKGDIGVADPGQPVQIDMPNPADYQSMDDLYL